MFKKLKTALHNNDNIKEFWTICTIVNMNWNFDTSNGCVNSDKQRHIPYMQSSNKSDLAVQNAKAAVYATC